MNCRLLKKGLLALSLIGLTTSCAIHRFYSPNRSNVSLFKQKNELKASVAAASGTDYEGVDIQGAYSVTNNIAVTANHFYTRGDRDSLTQRKYTEFGLGFYKKLNASPHIDWILETYAGYGQGRTKEFSPVPGIGLRSDLSFSKYYVQPSIGFRSDFVRMYVGLRMANLVFTDITNHSMPTSQYPVSERESIAYIRSHQSSFLLERTFGMAYGYKYIWLEMNIVYSDNLTAPEMVVAKNNFNIGLSLVLPFEDFIQ